MSRERIPTPEELASRGDRDLERDVAALAAEVASLRMALGCIRIVGTTQFGSDAEMKREIVAIVDLALGT